MRVSIGPIIAAFLLVAGLAPCSGDLVAADVSLSWNANLEPDLAGYKIYYGTAPRSYSTTINVGKITSYTVTGLNSGTYYFALTAYDSSGNESGFSNEASKTLSGTPDTTPPVISGVQATGVGNTFATIQWATTEPSDSQVEFGPTMSYGSVTTTNPSLVPSHSQLLAGLTANTTYHYRVKSKDATGNLAVSGDFVFATNNAVLSGPVAAYPLDENTGSIVMDKSGNANNGDFQNNPGWVAGKFGAALNFNGTNNYVSIPNSPSLDISGTGITIEMWVNIRDLGSIDYVLLSKSWFPSSMTAPYFQYAVEYDVNGNKTLDLYFGDSSGSLRGPFSMKPAVSTWSHVAFTYDGTSVKGFIDGAQQFSTPQSGSIQARGNSLRLGVDANLGQPYNGLLDEVRIYNRALTQAEIQSDMITPIGSFPSQTLLPAPTNVRVK